MKPHRESTENGDFSDPEGEFKIDFWGGIVSKYIRYENRFLNRKSAVIGARSSRLHEMSGLEQLRAALK